MSTAEHDPLMLCPAQKARLIELALLGLQELGTNGGILPDYVEPLVLLLHDLQRDLDELGARAPASEP